MFLIFIVKDWNSSNGKEKEQHWGVDGACEGASLNDDDPLWRGQVGFTQLSGVDHQYVLYMQHISMLVLVGCYIMRHLSRSYHHVMPRQPCFVKVSTAIFCYVITWLKSMATCLHLAQSLSLYFWICLFSCKKKPVHNWHSPHHPHLLHLDLFIWWWKKRTSVNRQKLSILLIKRYDTMNTIDQWT